ncbi:ATP-binding protein [Tellurirhabdus rosea]|uniref:ATP-binding protein n=1 Tax=Tellurirhabdus rosea TaxID=2674997 RepID=UPI00224E8517|nr:histidine kinase [Tellurirhabdus rosea]
MTDHLDRRVARRLTRFYVLALSAIGVLTISGLLFVRHTIRNQYDDGRVLNVAGRQRMLSQRLTKLALLRTEGIPAADTVPFDSLLDVWSQSHIQLRKGELVMEKPFQVRKSAELDQMFAQLEPVFQTMYRNFRQISAADLPDADRKAALGAVLREEPLYLGQMNDIVFRFDAENTERIRHLERVEWALGLATLLVVLLEGLFIFRPVVRHTRNVIWWLTQSEEALRRANDQLADTNERLLQTQAQLVEATEEKYRLQRAEDTVRSAALLEGQEEERRRFARDLHDGIGQMLTGLRLHVGKLKKGPFADEKQQQRLADLSELVQETIQTTRHVSQNLMPSVLEDYGLAAALQLLTEQVGRSSGIPVTFEAEEATERLAPATEISLYRIAQEAVNNAVKHAGAAEIHVTLGLEGERLVLRVTDDGRGFQAEKVHSGGLENMRTRARLLKADLRIASSETGTKVEIRV